MSEEKTKKERDKAQVRMKKLRESQTETNPKKVGTAIPENWYEILLAKTRERRANLTDDETQKERIELRERIRKWRATKTAEQQDEARIKAKEGMRTHSLNRTEEEKEFEKILKKHKMRVSRAQRSGKDKLKQNLEAKKGMQVLKAEGRLHDFQMRSSKNETETSDWRNFMKKGQTHIEQLSTEKPDIVERLNAEMRKEKERERKSKEEQKKKEKEGYWEYLPESDEYYWTGENEPDYGDCFRNTPPTKEDLRLKREAERVEFEWFVEEKKNEQKEKRKQKERARKEAMDNPIEPLPERELCLYEQIRENNIKERQDAMRECGFFEDLEATKRDIGLLRDINEKQRFNSVLKLLY